MPLEINIPLAQGEPLPNFEMQVVLEAVTYTLRIRWNDRLEAWFMTLLDEGAETILIAGMRLVVSWPINAYRSGSKIPGVFILFDTTGQDLDPQLNDLGVRVKLYYLTSTDLRG